MSRHLPITVWLARPAGTYPNAYVNTDDGQIRLTFFQTNAGPGVRVTLTRGLARAVARRLNQCLDQTR